MQLSSEIVLLDFAAAVVIGLSMILSWWAMTATAIIIDGGDVRGQTAWRYPQDALRVFGASAVGSEVVLHRFMSRGRGTVVTLDVANYSAAVVSSMPRDAASAVLTMRDSTFDYEAALIVVGALLPTHSPCAVSFSLTITSVVLTDAALLLRNLADSRCRGDPGSAGGLSVVLTNVTALWTLSVAASQVVPSSPGDDSSFLAEQVAAPVIVYNSTIRALMVINSTVEARLGLAFNGGVVALYFPTLFFLTNGAVFSVSCSAISAVCTNNNAVQTQVVEAIGHHAPVGVSEGSTYTVAHSTLTSTTATGAAFAQRFATTVAASTQLPFPSAAMVSKNSTLLWINCTVTVAATNSDAFAQSYQLDSSGNTDSITTAVAAIVLSEGSTLLWIGCDVLVICESMYNEFACYGQYFSLKSSGNVSAAITAAAMLTRSALSWINCSVRATGYNKNNNAYAQHFALSYNGSNGEAANATVAAIFSKRSSLLWINCNIVATAYFDSSCGAAQYFSLSYSAIHNDENLATIAAAYLRDSSALLWINCTVAVTHYNQGIASAQHFVTSSNGKSGSLTIAAAAALGEESLLVWTNCSVKVASKYYAYGQFSTLSYAAGGGDVTPIAAVALSEKSALLWIGCVVVVAQSDNKNLYGCAQYFFLSYSGGGTQLNGTIAAAAVRSSSAVIWVNCTVGATAYYDNGYAAAQFYSLSYSTQANAAIRATAAVLDDASVLLWINCSVVVTHYNQGIAAAQHFVTLSNGWSDSLTIAAAAALGKGSLLVWTNCSVKVASNFYAYGQYYVLYYSGNSTPIAAVALSEKSALLWVGCVVVVAQSDNKNLYGCAQYFFLSYSGGGTQLNGTIAAAAVRSSSAVIWVNCTVGATAYYDQGIAAAQFYSLSYSTQANTAIRATAAVLDDASVLLWINCTVASAHRNRGSASAQYFSLSCNEQASDVPHTRAALFVFAGSISLWSGCSVMVTAPLASAAAVVIGGSNRLLIGLVVDGSNSRFGIIGGDGRNSSVTLTGQDVRGIVWLQLVDGRVQNGGAWVWADLLLTTSSGRSDGGPLLLGIDPGSNVLVLEERAAMVVRCVEVNGDMLAAESNLTGNAASSITTAGKDSLVFLPCGQCDPRVDCLATRAVAASTVAGGASTQSCGPGKESAATADCFPIGSLLLAAQDQVTQWSPASHWRDFGGRFADEREKLTTTAAHTTGSVTATKSKSGGVAVHNLWHMVSLATNSRSASTPFPFGHVVPSPQRETEIISPQVVVLTTTTTTITVGAAGTVFGPSVSAQAARSGLLSSLGQCTSSLSNLEQGGTATAASLAPNLFTYVYSTPSAPPSQAWSMFAAVPMESSAAAAGGAATTDSSVASHASGVLVTTFVALVLLTLGVVAKGLCGFDDGN